MRTLTNLKEKEKKKIKVFNKIKTTNPANRADQRLPNTRPILEIKPSSIAINPSLTSYPDSELSSAPRSDEDLPMVDKTFNSCALPPRSNSTPPST